MVGHLRLTYPDAEAVLSTEQACIFCVTDSVSAHDVFKKVAGGLARPDQLSIVEVGRDIASSHPGLQKWHGDTRWLVDSVRETT